MFSSALYTNLLVMVAMMMIALIVSGAPAFSKESSMDPFTKSVALIKRFGDIGDVLDVGFDLGDGDLNLDGALGKRHPNDLLDDGLLDGLLDDGLDLDLGDTLKKRQPDGLLDDDLGDILGDLLADNLLGDN